jgi:release factor glutamine methyltransferase
MAPERTVERVSETACRKDALAGIGVREALTEITRSLADAALEEPARDARLLLAAALGVTGTDLIREPTRVIDCQSAARLSDFVARRTAREPVSRILGERGFYGRSFRITPATLDPRPATETLIEAALEIADREGWRSRPIRILDVGTGSGVLLLTLLAELPLATGLGTDISQAALDAARFNAERLGLDGRSAFARQRSLDGIAEAFDLMISNPPYIATDQIPALEAEVRACDPHGALDGGSDGLAIYRELALGLTRAVPDGWAIVEAGAGQAEAVAAILGQEAVAIANDCRFWKDLEGHTRAVAIRTQRYPRR